MIKILLLSVRDGRHADVHRSREPGSDLVIRTESTEDKHDGEHVHGGGSHQMCEWNGAFREGGAVFCFVLQQYCISYQDIAFVMN